LAHLSWEAPDQFIYDWRTARYSETPADQRPDIALVLVNDDSIARYFSRSPVDRALLAELVKAVDAAQPKAIGLDFIFDREAEPAKSEALRDAIKGAKAPIVLGVTTEREGPLSRENLQIQAEFVKATRNPEPRPAGTLFFGEQDEWITLGDDVIRTMGSPLGEGAYGTTFDLLLAGVDGPISMPKNRLIAWLLRPKDKKIDTFATLYVPTHKQVDGHGDGSALLPHTLDAALTGKIVIIGGDFIDRDQHRVPLSISTKARVPGAFIHAQIVAQLLDGRAIVEVPKAYEVVIVFLVCVVGYLISARFFIFGIELFSHLVFVAAIVIIGVILFSAWKIVLPTSTMFLGWLLGAIGGDHYERFAKIMSKLWFTAIDRLSRLKGIFEKQ
jgi:adenylate cyclase